MECVDFSRAQHDVVRRLLTIRSRWIGELVPSVHQVSSEFLLRIPCSLQILSAKERQSLLGIFLHKLVVILGCFEEEIESFSLIASPFLSVDPNDPISGSFRGLSDPPNDILAIVRHVLRGNLRVDFPAVLDLRQFRTCALQEKAAKERHQLASNLLR